MSPGGSPLAESLAEKLSQAESRLAQPDSPATVEEAVEILETACRQWPALMACLTDRAAWESLAAQIGRLERVALSGAGTLQAIEQSLNDSGSQFTGYRNGHSAKIDCRG